MSTIWKTDSNLINLRKSFKSTDLFIATKSTHGAGISRVMPSQVDIS